MLDFEALRRRPDTEAPNLFAFDASDRLILDEAAETLSAVRGDEVVVIGDRYGALTLGAAALHELAGIRVHQDPITAELALANNAEAAGFTGRFESLALGEPLLQGARAVLLQLPRSLAELDEIADTVARYAADDVVVFAGGRIKHLSLSMNEVLGRFFTEVQPSRARQKSRVLVARGVTRPVDAPPYPKSAVLAELGLTVVAHGGAFAGTTLDIGTRFLLQFFDRLRLPQHSAPGGQLSEQLDGQLSGQLGATQPGAQHPALTAIDLGCGTGILAARLAQLHPELAVTATDQSSAAVESARATMLANGLADRVTVVRDNGLSAQPTQSADLILCNPPFHVGSSVHTGVALALFRDAARVLKPGAQLFTVFNSHLGYQPDLRRIVGPTTVLGQSAKFTVTASTKPAGPGAAK